MEKHVTKGEQLCETLRGLTEKLKRVNMNLGAFVNPDEKLKQVTFSPFLSYNCDTGCYDEDTLENTPPNAMTMCRSALKRCHDRQVSSMKNFSLNQLRAFKSSLTKFSILK